MRDGATLARSGAAVAVLVTEEFLEEAAFIARAVGMPDVPIVRLPHPTAGVGEAAGAAIARQAAADIVDRLRGGLADEHQV